MRTYLLILLLFFFEPKRPWRKTIGGGALWLVREGSQSVVGGS